jgi:hypothetical protein
MRYARAADSRDLQQRNPGHNLQLPYQLADVMVNNWRPCASFGHVPGQAGGELAGHRRVAGDWLWCERMVTAITRRIVRGVVPGRVCAPRPALAGLSAVAFRDHDAWPGADRTEPGR